MSLTTTYTTDAGDYIIEFDYSPAEAQTRGQDRYEDRMAA